MENNYKAKYMQLKAKFMSSVDTAFRLGFEQGGQAAQQQQMMQQQAEQQQLEQQQSGMQAEPGDPSQEVNEQAPGMPGQVAQSGQDQDPSSAHPQGSELDQHIAQLEGMLGKGELSEPGMEALSKAVQDLKALQKNLKFQHEMKKSTAAIPEIAKALHRPAFKLGKVAQHNMDSNAKTAVSMQHKIVSDVMKSWASEEANASSEISKILGIEGLTKAE